VQVSKTGNPLKFPAHRGPFSNSQERGLFLCPSAAENMFNGLRLSSLILAANAAILATMKRALAVLAILFVPASGLAQSLTPFERQMLELAGHFGTMHHLNQICESDNMQIWRDSMLELLRLEDPSRVQRERMSRRFNDAYGEVEERFPRCTSDARRYAQQLGQDGANLTDEMAQSLR